MKLSSILPLALLSSTVTCSDFYLPPFLTVIDDSIKNEGCFAEIHGLKVRDKDSKKRTKPVMFSLFKDLDIVESEEEDKKEEQDEQTGQYQKAFKDFRLFLVNSGYIRNLKDFEGLFTWVDEKDYKRILLGNGYDESQDYCTELREIEAAASGKKVVKEDEEEVVEEVVEEEDQKQSTTHNTKDEL